MTLTFAPRRRTDRKMIVSWSAPTAIREALVATQNSSYNCGMQTRLAVRPGNPPAPESGHERLLSLDEIA